MKKKTTVSKKKKSHVPIEYMEKIEHDIDEFAKYYDSGINNTIVFYGSAAIRSEEQTETVLNEVEAKLEKTKKPGRKLWTSIEDASAAVYMSHYYHAAEELAYRLSKWSKSNTKPADKYLLCSGGGPGIMEATNRGASRAGEESVGLRIVIPLEQSTNHYVTPEFKFEFNYFMFRKFTFLQHARAIVVFPGGFGTLDELFDVLNLLKTRKIEEPMPVVLFGSEFWRKIIDFRPMVDLGVVNASDLAAIHYSDDVEDAFKYITSHIKTRKKRQKS